MGTELIDAAETHRIAPETFDVPTEEEIAAIVIGTFVKLGTRFPAQRLDPAKHPQGNLLTNHPLTKRKTAGERFGVEVVGLHGDTFSGTVKNHLLFPYLHGYNFNDDLIFKARHIMTIGAPD